MVPVRVCPVRPRHDVGNHRFAELLVGMPARLTLVHQYGTRLPPTVDGSDDRFCNFLLSSQEVSSAIISGAQVPSEAVSAAPDGYHNRPLLEADHGFFTPAKFYSRRKGAFC